MSAGKKRFQTLDVAGIRCSADFSDVISVMQEGLKDSADSYKEHRIGKACVLSCGHQVFISSKCSKSRCDPVIASKLEYNMRQASHRLSRSCGVDSDRMSHRMKASRMSSGSRGKA